MKSSSRGLVIVVLAGIILIAALFLLMRRQPVLANSASAQKSLPAAADATRLATPARDALTNKTNVSTLSPATTGTAVSSLNRGPNNRLLLEPARDLSRQTVPGTVSDVTVLAVRSGPITGPLTVDEHTTSAIEAVYNPAAFNEFLQSDTGLFRLPLEAEREVVVQVDKVIARGEATRTLVGKVQGDPFSDVLITFHDGAVHGSVSFFDSNTHYQFAMAGNGDIAIRKLDPDSFNAPCGNPGESAPDEVTSPADDPMTSEGDVEAEPPAGSLVIDSVVGYGREARIADGGVAAIEARIINSVDRMNTAFGNSQVGVAFISLLAMIEDPDYVFPGLVTGDMGSADELGDLNTHGDGILDVVSQLRIDLGADQNAFVVKQADGSAGIAYWPGKSMMVARDYMTSTRITFAHEFGHNIGCRHAWADSSATDPVNVYNYGWRLSPPSATEVRTIMAYDWSWGSGARIPYYSNPDVSYNGAKTGATDGYDATGDATADPRAVSGGYIGTAGTGYDGTHPSLGARNADYINAYAGTVADNATRTVLTVLDPASGVTWTNGQIYTVFWYGGDQTDLATISLHKGGVFQSNIASNIPAENRWFSWAVPTNQTYGNDYQIRVTLNGASFDDSSAFTIGVPLSPAQIWRQTYFGTTENLGNAADDFDFDNDGVVNALERAFGTNPTNTTSFARITYALVDGAGNPGNEYFAISYPRITGGTPASGNGYAVQEFTYTLEHSGSLTSDWSASDFVLLNVTLAGDGIETATFRLDRLFSGETAHLVRFRLTVE